MSAADAAVPADAEPPLFGPGRYVDPIERLAIMLWVRGPRAIIRRAPAAWGIAGDGHTLVAAPPVAVLAPVFVVLGFFATGFLQLGYEQVYTESLAVMVLAVGLGALSAQLGVLAVVSLAVGELLVPANRTLTAYGRFIPTDPPDGPVQSLLQVWLPMVITYLLLAVAVVVVPRTARALVVSVGRWRTIPPALAWPLASGLFVVVVWLGVATWTAAAPTLVRPRFTWLGGQPTVEAVSALQEQGDEIVAAAVLVAIARQLLIGLSMWWAPVRDRVRFAEADRVRAPKRDDGADPAAPAEAEADSDAAAAPAGAAGGTATATAVAEPGRFRRMLGDLAAAALGTLVLAGVLEEGWLWVVTFVVFLAVRLLRSGVITIGPLERWKGWMARVPAVVRAVVLFLAARVVTDALVRGFVESYSGVALVVIIGTVVVFVVFPGAPRRAPGAGGPERDPARPGPGPGTGAAAPVAADPPPPVVPPPVTPATPPDTPAPAPPPVPPPPPPAPDRPPPAPAPPPAPDTPPPPPLLPPPLPPVPPSPAEGPGPDRGPVVRADGPGFLRHRLDRLPIRHMPVRRLTIGRAGGVAGAWLAAAVVQVLWADPAAADNCGTFADCFGVTDSSGQAAFGLAMLSSFSLLLDFTPIVGDVKGVIEGVVGRDLLTGEELPPWARALGFIPFLPAADALRAAGKLDGAIDILGAAGRHGDDAGDLAGVGRHTDDAGGLGRHGDEAAAAGGGGRPPRDGGGDGGGGGRPPDDGPPPRSPDGEPPRAPQGPGDVVRATAPDSGLRAAEIDSAHRYEAMHPGERLYDYEARTNQADYDYYDANGRVWDQVGNPRASPHLDMGEFTDSLQGHAYKAMALPEAQRGGVIVDLTGFTDAQKQAIAAYLDGPAMDAYRHLFVRIGF